MLSDNFVDAAQTALVLAQCLAGRANPGRRAWSQPIATMTNPALISTVAAMKSAVSSGVMIQLLRIALHSRGRTN